MTGLAAVGVPELAFALAGGVVVALGVYTWWRSRLGPVPPGSECLRAKPSDVAVGGALRLGRFGDDGEDVELEVARRVSVHLGGEDRLELAGGYRGRTLAIEWGPRRVVAYRRTSVPIAELGLDLAQLEASKAGATLTVREATLRVEETGDAIRRGPAATESLAVRTWGLLDEEKRAFVRVDRAGEQPPLASEGVLVASDAIEIVRLGPPGAASGAP